LPSSPVSVFCLKLKGLKLKLKLNLLPQAQAQSIVKSIVEYLVGFVRWRWN
jgi:hypothetical protein